MPTCKIQQWKNGHKIKLDMSDDSYPQLFDQLLFSVMPVYKNNCVEPLYLSKTTCDTSVFLKLSEQCCS